MPTSIQILFDILLLPDDQPTVGIAWTLQYEMLFYMLFALLMVNRMLGLVTFGIWFCAIVAAAVLQWRPDTVIVSRLVFLGNIQFFLGGMVALLARRSKVPFAPVVFGAGLVAFLSFGILENSRLLDGYGDTARLAYGGTCAVLLAGLVGCERQGLVRMPRALLMLGEASYAIYLFHLIVFGLVWQVLLRTGLRPLLSDDVVFALLVVSAIALSYVISIVIEAPLIAWTRRRLDALSNPARTRAVLSRDPA